MRTQVARDVSIRFLPIAAPVFFWLLLSGLSLRSSAISTLVIAWICCWGFLTLGIIFKDRSITQSTSPWMVGPSFCVGTFTLFVVRIFTYRDLFLLSFALVPIFWMVIQNHRIHSQTDSLAPSQAGRDSWLFEALKLFNLMGLALVLAFGNWQWIIPIAILTLLIVLTALSVSSARIREILIRGGIALTAGLAMYGVSFRSSNWFRVAEDPYDETILQAISHGLLEWGPLVDPLSRGRGSLSALAYHHLIYLDVGLVEFATDLEVYRSLLIVGPIMAAFAISTSLMLLIQKWSQREKQSESFNVYAYVGAATFVLGLTGTDGFTSISTHFGIASVLAAIYLISEVFECSSLTRQIIAIFVISGTVAFAKYPFLYVVPLVAVVLACFEPKRNWKLILASVVGSSLIVSMSLLSRDDSSDRLQLGFLTNKKFGGRPALSQDAILTFLDIVVSPMSLGIAGLSIALLVSSPLNRRDYFAYGAVVLAAIVLGSTITAAGGGEDYFVIPGQIFSLLALARLLTEASPKMRLDFISIACCVMIYLALSQISEHLDSRTMSLRNIMSVFVLTVVPGWSRFSDWSLRRENTRTVQRARVVVLILLMWSTVLNSVHYASEDKYNLDPFQTTLPAPEEGWYGNRYFREMVVFANSRTDRSSLWAFSICRTPSALEDGCLGFRPAALIERQFLFLAKKFSGQELSSVLLEDFLLSQSIGIQEPPRVITELRQRNVDYVLCDRSLVGDAWQRAFQESGAVMRFSNEAYSLFEI